MLSKEEIIVMTSSLFHHATLVLLVKTRMLSGKLLTPVIVKTTMFLRMVTGLTFYHMLLLMAIMNKMMLLLTFYHLMLWA